MAGKKEATLEVTAGFFPLAFFLFAFSPQIEIDGQAHRKTWGTHTFQVPPGKHTVTVYFEYLLMPRCGENTVSITVQEGQTCRVRFYMPPWMFAKGSMTVS